jgi:L-histidine N-alpha-methyltransferase
MSPVAAIDVHLGADYALSALRSDVLRGLTATPKELPPKWFYDERGSQLFDEITRLPEYYPTRRERAILRERAFDIAKLGDADVLIELGAGTSEKTRLLLDAMEANGRLKGFVPFDVSAETLRATAYAVASEYPGAVVHGVVGDFERHLGVLPRDGRRLIAFLGGTIGNLYPPARARFYRALADAMGPGDALLLGTDLVKKASRLHAAYDDSRGVTAEFNKNVLYVLNRELGADFDVDAFEHVARWDDEAEWITMSLRSLRAQTVRISSLDLTVSFEDGEEMRTEISAKFRRSGVERELAAAGLELAHWWTDGDGDFALSLAFPVRATPLGATSA